MTAFLALLGCAGERPTGLGPQDSRLAGCPDSPNCVSSFETRDSHSIEPLNASLEQVRAALRGMDRVNIVREEPNYLYAEFTSRLMRFVDDVEFLAVPAQNLVHVRSASRLGHSDVGVNRKRVEAIREAIAAQ
jgi:uncharacterized protein (DUF1499 family)